MALVNVSAGCQGQLGVERQVDDGEQGGGEGGGEGERVGGRCQLHQMHGHAEFGRGKSSVSIDV